MTKETGLSRLMRRAFDDKHAEPAFFRALLKATVYAHAPRYDRGNRLRLIQFTLPTSKLVLPFFSEYDQAAASAGASARIVAMTGRQLLELTRGATLALNPNSISCLLYPEEIAALLDRDEVAIIERVQLEEPTWQVCAAKAAPQWLTDLLTALYAKLAYVHAAHLAELYTPSGTGWIVAIAVREIDAERAARATTTQLQPACDSRASRSVDLTTFEPGSPPAWLAELGISPFYRRRGESLG